MMASHMISLNGPHANPALICAGGSPQPAGVLIARACSSVLLTLVGRFVASRDCYTRRNEQKRFRTLAHTLRALE